MISAQQAQFYARHGFVVVDNILDAEKIREAIGAIDELLDPSNLGKAFEMEPQDGSTVRRIWSPTQNTTCSNAWRPTPRCSTAYSS